MKTLMKRAVGHMIRPFVSGTTDPIAVVTYHSVGGGALGSQPMDLFRAQIDWLAKHAVDFPVLPLRTALSLSPAITGTRVLITFDDGYRDNVEVAAPILEEFGLRATFFVSSAFIDGDACVTAGFKNYSDLPNMTWEHLSKLTERGHEIGLHGHRHADYAQLSPAEAEEDIRHSHELIKLRTGFTPVSFAYAFGQPRHQRSDLAPVFQRLGIQYAFTSVHRRANARSLTNCADLRFSIPRLRVDPRDSLPIFVEKVRGLWDWIAVVQEFTFPRFVLSHGPTRAGTR
jgi:peptidoglycan/xylan/chitin deacetylase (PgdA/CDA1 family)